jgi:hypothetical protein
MGLILPHTELAETLVSRINVVSRMTVTPGQGSHRTRREHISNVIDKARAAIAAGDSNALEEALRSLDLLSFELCEE